jgi:catalase
LSTAQKLSGQDPDFHRKDLEAAINGGAPPKWTFSIQVIPSDKENAFDFECVYSVWSRRKRLIKG